MIDPVIALASNIPESKRVALRSVVAASAYRPELQGSSRLRLPTPAPRSYSDFTGPLISVPYTATIISIDGEGKLTTASDGVIKTIELASEWFRHADVYGHGHLGEGATKRAIFVRT
jgi:hypothetical protein